MEMTLSLEFMVKFISLNIAFTAFIACIMNMCKKSYKNIPLFSILLLLAFWAYCFSIVKLM